MANRYNPPPGWLVPGAGWRPPWDWVPDAAWPPAPIGWQFWIEDDAEAASDQASVPTTVLHLLPEPIRRVRRWYGGLVVVAGLIGIVAITAVLSSQANHRRTAVLVTSVPPVVVIATSSSPPELTAASPVAERPAAEKHPAKRMTSTAGSFTRARPAARPAQPARPAQTHRPASTPTWATTAPKPPTSPSQTQVDAPPATSSNGTQTPQGETPPPTTDESQQPTADPGDVTDLSQ